jgi:uncharacterized protein YjdB
MVIWSSSDAGVVEIDPSKGTVLSSSSGEATITAVYPDKSQVVGSRKVTVM